MAVGTIDGSWAHALAPGLTDVFCSSDSRVFDIASGPGMWSYGGLWAESPCEALLAV